GRGRPHKGAQHDRVGFRRGFETEWGGAGVRNHAALLVGAGGAGRAVAFALFDLGVNTVLVHDQNPSQAQALVRAVTSAFGDGRARVGTDPAAAPAPGTRGRKSAPGVMLGVPRKPV